MRVFLISTIVIILGVTVWAAATKSSTGPDPADPSPEVIDTPTDDPTEEPTEPEPAPSEEPSETETPEEHLPPVEPGTELSEDEQIAVQDTIVEGFSEWLHIDTRETLKERQKRLKDFISPDSTLWTTTEEGVYPEDWQKVNPEEDLYTETEISNSNPIGGDEKDFRSILAVSVALQITLHTPEGNSAEIYRGIYQYEVAARIEDGQWKIYDYKEL